jgi:uncharacterized membrane protein SpoIIM required for sporulation
MLLGAFAGYALVASDSDRWYEIVPAGLAGDRDPSATTTTLREALYAEESPADRLAAFASFLFTHNAQVGLLSFALGFFAGLPTLFLMLANGLMLGAFSALYADRGLSGELWAWLLPHGIPELSAIALCGAAGFVLGHALVFPGRATRLENLARRGRDAGVLVLGAVVLLFVAALVEGIFRQAVHSVPVRYGLASVMATGLVLWIGFAGRERS